MRSHPSARTASALRSVATTVVMHVSENSDVNGTIVNAFNRVADFIDQHRREPTKDDLEQILGPRVHDPVLRNRQKI